MQNKELLQQLIDTQSEIKRLREALSEIEEHWTQDYHEDKRGFNIPSEIATEALKQTAPSTGLIDLAVVALEVDKIEQHWIQSPQWTTEDAERHKKAIHKLWLTKEALTPAERTFLRRLADDFR